MSLEITGKLHVKYDAQNVTSTFKTREFVLEMAEEINGNTYTNYAKLQLVQNKCEILDRFNVGDVVKVSFNIKGRSYVDKKDGTTKYISNMDAWRIESATSAPAGNAPANHPAPAYNQQPAYNQAPAYNNSGNSGNTFPPAQNFSPAQNFNASPQETDDLPF